MKARHISQIDFKAIQNNNWVRKEVSAISIITEEKDIFPLHPNWKDSIQLMFADTDDSNDPNKFTEKHAEQLIEFILKNKDSDFTVHCYMGVSRSAAIAIFINKLLIPNFETRYQLYNKRVLTILENTYMSDKYYDPVLNYR